MPSIRGSACLFERRVTSISEDSGGCRPLTEFGQACQWQDQVPKYIFYLFLPPQAARV
jgi:hypothetical protein